MQIKVRGYLTFRKRIGVQAIEFTGDRKVVLQEFLENLANDLDAEFKAMVAELSEECPSERIAVLINGQHYSHLAEKLQTVLEDGDEISVFPPMAGG